MGCGFRASDQPVLGFLRAAVSPAASNFATSGFSLSLAPGLGSVGPLAPPGFCRGLDFPLARAHRRRPATVSILRQELIPICPQPNFSLLTEPEQQKAVCLFRKDA